jgi:glycosyltransferase involved in cell wall biosynthesis
MTTIKKRVSLVSPCFNEEANVEELYRQVCKVMAGLPQYEFEYLFIDNASTDQTLQRLKDLAARDHRVKIIVNTRNFGHLRSPYWGIIQTRGDATIYLASDLQDPPELIPQFLAAWEEGSPIVLAVKPVSQTNPLIHWLRKFYYRVLDTISEVAIIKDATGFGLYDRAVLDQIRQIGDPQPFFRGLIFELGFPIKTVPFSQQRRQRGISKNNAYTLYDLAMLGIVSHSVVPIRLAAVLGFMIGFLSFLVAFVFLILKLSMWDTFPIGIAPIVIGMFLMFGIVLTFIGILGEYIASIHTYVRHRPVVVELERINFED